MVNFRTRIPNCDSYSPAFLSLFLISDPSICSAVTFPPLGNPDHVFVSVSIIDFPSNSKRMPLFIAQLMTILVLAGTFIVII